MKHKSKIVFFFRSENRYSILLGRRYGSNLESFWWLPGGGVEMNESVFDAAVREVGEELVAGAFINKSLQNAIVKNIQPPCIEYMTSDSTNTVYFIKINYPEVPGIKEEFEEMKWFNMGELPSEMSREYAYVQKFLEKTYLEHLENVFDYSRLND